VTQTIRAVPQPGLRPSAPRSYLPTPVAAAGPFVYTKAGYATAGGNGYGPSESSFVETGFATVAGVAVGARALLYSKTGYATAGLVGAGPSASVFVESGFATAGGVATGARQTDHLRSGSRPWRVAAAVESCSSRLVRDPPGSDRCEDVHGGGGMCTKAGYATAW
jgi:hypothetical protein